MKIKTKDYTEIFSDDDKDTSKNEKDIYGKLDGVDYSENDLQNDDVIRHYVLELTMGIVEEVCRRSESSHSNSKESKVK